MGTIYYPDGQITSLYNMKYCDELHILSGSFNPLHEGHKEIYDLIPHDNKYFEVSVKRRGKNDYTDDDIARIVSQFKWYAPIIINHELITFLDKYSVMRPQANTIYFHIGYDTFERMKYDYGTYGVHTLPFNLVVYDRDGKSLDFETDKIKRGIRKVSNISSTELRDKTYHMCKGKCIRPYSIMECSMHDRIQVPIEGAIYSKDGSYDIPASKTKKCPECGRLVENRCDACMMVYGRRGWRQLGMYDG